MMGRNHFRTTLSALSAGGVTVAGTALLWAGLIAGGAGSASADALCDAMRAQYGPNWPCISVPPPPSQELPSAGPTTPGQPTGGGGVRVGADTGPGPGEGNGTPIVPVPGQEPQGGGNTQSPARTQAPATVPVQPGTPTRTTTTGAPQPPAATTTPAPKPQSVTTTQDKALVPPLTGDSDKDDERLQQAGLIAAAAVAFVVGGASTRRGRNTATARAGATKASLVTGSGSGAGPEIPSLLPRGGSERATIGNAQLVLINDPTSPNRYVFDVDVPPGGDIRINPDGSATVLDKSGKPVAYIKKPWAYDALGRPQKTWYTVEDGKLVQHVEPSDNALYPILADPDKNTLATTRQQQQAAKQGKPAHQKGTGTTFNKSPNAPKPPPPTSAPSNAPDFGGKPHNQANTRSGLPPSQTASGPEIQPPEPTPQPGPEQPTAPQPPADQPSTTPPPANLGQPNYEKPTRRYTDPAGNPVAEFTDPATGNKTVLSIGDRGGQIAEVFNSAGVRLLREERYSGGTLDDGSDAGITIRQFDYRTGKNLILNYDAQGRLYNSGYSDPNVSVLLKPGGSLSATLINPDGEYDWAKIAQAVPREFAESGEGHPITLTKGDEQLTLNPDGSSVLANLDTDRALHFEPGDTEPSKITRADGTDLDVGDGLYDFGKGLWDGSRSLIGLGPHGTWDTWKGVGDSLGTIIMYLPNSMDDAMHGAANAGKPGGYQHPNRENALFQALTGVNPQYIRTSPAYAAGMLAGVAGTTASPGAVGALAKALRPGPGVDLTRSVPKGKNPLFTQNLPANITHIESVHSGGPQKLFPNGWSDALNNPQPNTRYIINNRFVFDTGPNGKPLRVTGPLTLNPGQRAPWNQGAIVRNDGILGLDEGGHLIARMFGGPGEKLNLTPMLQSLNRGGGSQLTVIENSWRNLLQSGHAVTPEIKLHYGANPVRPDFFTFKWYDPLAGTYKSAILPNL